MRTIENKAGATTVSSFTYTVNAIGQRESVATAGTAFAGTQADWAWKYDALGQVVAADHANTPAADRAYQFDTIGNRVKTASGTLTLPGTANWVSNALNQYTTVNGVVQPTTPAPAPFDADGNMTAGPVPGTNGNNPGAVAPANATDIKWDAENRLISLKIGTATYGYVYDHLSRLTTRSANGTVSRRYHYDGWNRIAEFSNSALLDTFTWGLDLSGTMQGAGGVGGLLVSRWVSAGSVDYFPTYDGNGNVSEYLGITGNNVAHYEYDPFGTLTRRTGSTSTRLQYRFSTKPRDVNTGLYYYGYRWYDPVTGRWPSRDPIEERGGVNLYGFVGNDGVNSLDRLGLTVFTAITFIPVNFLQDPTGTWFKGDGQPENTSKDRKDYRTLQEVTVKLDDVTCNEDFDAALNEILKQRRDTGVTIRYKPLNEFAYYSDEELSQVAVPGLQGYEVDAETQLERTKATWIESNPGDIILRKKENGKCRVCALRFKMVADAANPLGKPGSPHINYKYAFDYTIENGWKVSGTHDGYPSYLLHMDDKLIHHYSAVGHTPLELIGDSDETFVWQENTP